MKNDLVQVQDALSSVGLVITPTVGKRLLEKGIRDGVTATAKRRDT